MRNLLTALTLTLATLVLSGAPLAKPTRAATSTTRRAS